MNNFLRNSAVSAGKIIDNFIYLTKVLSAFPESFATLCPGKKIMNNSEKKYY